MQDSLGRDGLSRSIYPWARIHRYLKALYTLQIVFLRIPQDLAGLVDGQQEQIDHLVDKVEESKANTRQGLEHIHESIQGMCGPHNAGDSKKATDYWSMDDVLDFATACQSTIHTNIVEKGICSPPGHDFA